MNKIITCYNELAAQLYHIYNEHKTPYFSGHIQVEDFILTLSCIFNNGDIIPIWWDHNDEYDFEFDKLKTKYKELYKQ